MADAVEIDTTRADDRADTRQDPPLRWPDVLLAECQRLNPAFVAPPADDQSDESARLDRLNHAAFEEGRAALCLSGGGIRSASFAVGVLQGLGQRGLLQGFDYLSTVSGGGFAGSWLSAWLHRAGPQGAAASAAANAPASPPSRARQALNQFEGRQSTAGDLEPWPVSRLRLYTRYLSPQTGLFSADFWGLVATMIRNILLNWAVLLPMLAAAMLVPRFQFALIHVLEQEPDATRSVLLSEDVWALGFGAIAYTVGLIHIIANLPSYGNRAQSERQFVFRCLVPLSIGTLALTYYWASWGIDPKVSQVAAVTAGASALIWAVTGFFVGSRPFRPRTWIAAALAGAVGALTYEAIFIGLFSYDDLSRGYVALSFPLVMCALMLHGVMFVGIAGREMSAADLEWWSRAAAWVLIVAAGWLVVCAVAFGVPMLVDRLIVWTPGALHALGGAAAALAAITSWLLRPAGEAAAPSWARRAALALIAPLSVILIAAGVAALDGRLVVALTRITGEEGKFLASFQKWPICDPSQEDRYSLHRCHPADSGFVETVLAFTGLLVLGLITTRLVPANKFSLHDMYHHRLARAYLGASRDKRRPNAFTGFDPDDDLEMAALAGQRPLHVVNTTLNTRLDPRLGQKESKALSFTFSPLHAGSHALDAYRPAAQYAYNPLRRCGITLGSAVTISGAAASPQMGEFTSPALAFLLALFNARLGVWLGNPGEAGHDTWWRRDPTAGIAPIIRETLGWTTDANPYVFLSDGGHFDNLGVWEMLLRRVRYIVVVDSGCDPDYSFPDLAAAVRHARVDHGAEITFDPDALNALRDDAMKPHVVTGTIRYTDAPAGEFGTIVYIKPALSNDEPVDVVTYRKAHPTFPHESTANQWFTDAQFESYRALGFHSVQAALADDSDHGLGRMAARLLKRQVPVPTLPAVPTVLTVPTVPTVSTVSTV